MMEFKLYKSFISFRSTLSNTKRLNQYASYRIVNGSPKQKQNPKNIMEHSDRFKRFIQVQRSNVLARPPPSESNSDSVYSLDFAFTKGFII